MRTSCWMTLAANQYKKRGLLSFLCLALILIGACNSPPSKQSLSGSTMGTYYSVTLIDFSGDINALKKNIDQVLLDINKSMSTYDVDSELSRLNRSPIKEWLPISKPLYDVINTSLYISKLSKGQYDITVGPLVNLWGFGPGKTLPKVSDDEVNALIDKVGYKSIKLSDQPYQLMKKAPIVMDLSSLAKGYGVDAIYQLLISQGLEHFLVDIGGELRAAGLNAQNKPWQIGIEKPSLVPSGATTIASLHNKSVATSGDYRNYYEQNGQKFSHVIDPKTGRPITHSVASVTVVHDSAMTADALATAYLVMGADRALKLAERDEIAAYFILYAGDGFDTQASSAFKHYIN